MGRQFSYYAFPEDLAEIEREVFQKFGGNLLVAEKRDTRHHIAVAGSFPLAVEQMETESLFLLLAPPEPLKKVAFSGAWLDVSRSNLIEVGRSYIKDGQVGEARFWYEPAPLIDGQFVEKPAEFLNWASQIYRHTKKLLVRHSYKRGNHRYSSWCGKVAKQEFAAERFAPR